MALERTAWLCVRCGARANEVDHRLSLGDGGEPFDQANLDPLCHSCHSKKGLEGRGEQEWVRAPCKITLLHGPPGADLIGKLRELVKAPGRDFVVSSDLIAQRMFVGVTWSAMLCREDALLVGGERNSMLKVLRAGKTPKRSARAFVLSNSPTAKSFLPFHVALEVDPGLPVMLNRVESGELPEDPFRELILSYYTDKQAQSEGRKSPLRPEPTRSAT
jgi:hypothetical protein